MQCVCCLGSEGRKLTSFKAADKKLYLELTRLELVQKTLKICAECKLQLKSSSDFFRMCLESHKQMENKLKEVTKPKRAKRLSKAVIEEDFNYTRNDDSMPETESHDDGDEMEHEILLETSQAEVKQVSAKSPNSKFLCNDCNMSFKTSHRLKLHSHTHSGLKSWECSDCDKVFATKFRLKAHYRIHTGERPFACDHCPLTFAQGNALKCHLRVHTKEKPFVCKICQKTFAQNTTLKTHMVALHTGKNIECDVPGCDKKFTRRSYLILHKRDHAGERKYSCDRCPNQYKQKSHLDRHIEASHLGIRHKCSFPGCAAEFSKSWSLKMHKFTHTSEPGQLPYQCDNCVQGFQRRDKLLKHRAKFHPSDKSAIKESLEIKEPVIDVDPSNYLVLSSPPEIYTIENSDGTFTQVQTLQIVEES